MAKLTIHPPGTPFEPDHPFATPQILFVPRLFSPPPASTAKRWEPNGEAGSATGASTDAEFVKVWAEMLENLDERLRASGRTVSVINSPHANEFEATFLQAGRVETERLALVPQLPPDLEDIAFKILRLHYKGR